MDLAGIGRLVEWGKLWRLTYERCGHVVQFSRRDLREPEEAERVVKEYLATCDECGQPPPRGLGEDLSSGPQSQRTSWGRQHQNERRRV